MRISTADFIRNFGERVDQAMVEPATVTRHGRDRLVVLSAEAYARLTRRGPQSSRARDLAADDATLFGMAEPATAFTSDSGRRR